MSVPPPPARYKQQFFVQHPLLLLLTEAFPVAPVRYLFVRGICPTHTKQHSAVWSALSQFVYPSVPVFDGTTPDIAIGRCGLALSLILIFVLDKRVIGFKLVNP